VQFGVIAGRIVLQGAEDLAAVFHHQAADAGQFAHRQGLVLEDGFDLGFS